ncbi:permease-like cell division protein FtsX [Nonomuraea sp. NPDC050404]|uniref:permease-like cell division protein FtsX n=1 Tax=Nonomuraea sp. NPDC050404 TaxID=3155783 RepID=UPI0033D32818
MAAVAVLGMPVIAGGPPAEGAIVEPEVVVGGEWELSVFLCTPAVKGCHQRYATAGQKRRIRALLEKVPEVTEVRFVDRPSAYRSFRRDFSGRGALLKAVRAKDLPESFQVRMVQGADRDRVRAAVVKLPGVQEIETYSDPVVLQDFHKDHGVSVFLCRKGSDVPACGTGRGAADGARVTSREKKAIVSSIKRMPEVESYIFEDKKTAFRNFSEIYADNEALVAASRVSDMPESYRLAVRPTADWDLVSLRLARLKGVSQVLNDRCQTARATLSVKYGLDKLRNRTDDKVCAPG